MNTLTKTIFLAAFAALPLTSLNAQSEKASVDNSHKIVFEVTMEGAEPFYLREAPDFKPGVLQSKSLCIDNSHGRCYDNSL